MGTLAWNNLREFDGSQQAAFEELCCQLTASTRPPHTPFVRKGAPDAGLECFWTDDSGSEHGCQAKFFTSSPTAGQWSQIDDSVKTALNKHPLLASLTIWSATNLPDARETGKKGAQDKWDDYVARWTSIRAKRGRPCEFRFSGQSTIFTELLKDHHAGLARYFFDADLFTHSSFLDFLTDQKTVLAPRYSPHLHVDTPLASYFAATVRDTAFIDDWNTLLRKLADETRLYLGDLDKHVSSERQILEAHARRALSQFLEVDTAPPALLPMDDLLKVVDDVDSAISSFLFKVTITPEDAAAVPERPDDFTDQIESRLWNLRRAIGAIRAFLTDQALELSNGKPMLLLGEGGAGKTHALCDLADRRLAQNAPFHLFIGSTFTNAPLLPQICQQLGTDFKSWDAYFGAIQSVAQREGHLGIVCIDGLNEATDLATWRNHLPAMLNAANRHPYLRVIISVRSPMEDEVLSEPLRDRCVAIRHTGLGAAYVKAAAKYFDYYGIDGLTSPPLTPEFQNPLFLQLYCKAHQGQCKAEGVGGQESFTLLFSAVIDNTQRRLAQLQVPGIDPHGTQIRQALQAFADRLIDTDSTSLPRDDARSICDDITPPSGVPFANTLFGQLISEGLLITFPIRHDRGTVEHRVALGFQRFTDFLIASRLVDRFVDTNNPRSAFADGGTLREQVLHDQGWFLPSDGVYTALAIIVSERFRIELPSLLPHPSTSEAYRESLYLESVLWRDQPAVPLPLAERLLDAALTPRGYDNFYLDIVLKLAVSLNSPLNAEHLHKVLSAMSMPDRDARWTISVQQAVEYDEPSQSPLHVLIEWLWPTGSGRSMNQSQCSQQTALLAGTVLFWCFSLSQRVIRDRATKAAVELLKEHPNALSLLITRFDQVDDPYVIERLAAVALGVATHLSDNDSLVPIVDSLYNAFYATGAPPANILFRDYVARLVEYVDARNVQLQPTWSIMTKPQHDYLTASPPSLDQLKAPYRENTTPHARGLSRIWSSMTQGDFDRYIATLPYRFHETAKRRPSAHEAIELSQLSPPHAFVRRWILNRVLQLGWTEDRFDGFDSDVGYDGRMSHRLERIGKKYQWIAWRELAARLDDSFEFAQEDDDNADTLRWRARQDIDPTLLYSRSASDDWRQPNSSWWKPLAYNGWLPIGKRRKWLRATSDVPRVLDALVVTQHDGGPRWVTLSAHYSWRKEPEIEEGTRGGHTPNLFLIVRGYAIATSDRPRLESWGHSQWFRESRLPDDGDVDCFLGEYPLNTSASDSSDLINPDDWSNASPVPLWRLQRDYHCGYEYDGSVQDSLNLSVPAPWLVNHFDMATLTAHAEFSERHGKLCFRDPSLIESGPSTVLADHDAITDLLRDKDLLICWAIYGEKNWVVDGPEEFVGFREFSGVFFYDGNRIDGKLRTRFRSPTDLARESAERRRQMPQNPLLDALNEQLTDEDFLDSP